MWNNIILKCKLHFLSLICKPFYLCLFHYVNILEIELIWCFDNFLNCENFQGKIHKNIKGGKLSFDFFLDKTFRIVQTKWNGHSTSRDSWILENKKLKLSKIRCKFMWELKIKISSWTWVRKMKGCILKGYTSLRKLNQQDVTQYATSRGLEKF